MNNMHQKPKNVQVIFFSVILDSDNPKGIILNIQRNLLYKYICCHITDNKEKSEMICVINPKRTVN